MKANKKLLLGYQIVLSIFIAVVVCASAEGRMPPVLGEKDLKVRLEKASKRLENIRGNKTEKDYVNDEESLCNFFYQLSDFSIREFQELSLVINFTTKAIQAPSAKVKACAAEAMGWYGNQDAASVLLEAMKYDDKEVQLQSAGALLQLGHGVDAALETLDKLAQEKNTLGEMLRWQHNGRDWFKGLVTGQDDLWDPNGERILKKALNSPNIEIVANALYYFAVKGERGVVYPKALSIINQLKDKDIRNYFPEYANYNEVDLQHLYPSDIASSPNINNLYSDGRACEAAINALKRVNSRESIPLLEEISKKNIEWWHVCSGIAAKHALQEMGFKNTEIH